MWRVLIQPAPFGFELNKATFEEVTKKYPKCQTLEIPSSLKGKSIRIEASNFELEGIVDFVFMNFDSKGVLHSVNFELPLNKFDSMFNTLKKDYKLITSRTNDGLYAEFENENSLVYVSNLDLDGIPGESLMVDYYTKAYKKAMDAELEAQGFE